MRRIFLVALVSVLSPCFAAKSDPTQNQIKELGASYIHGTIVIVVPTKQGFVLAADSMGSNGCVPASGEFEKVFTIGNGAAIAIAGLLSTSSDTTQQLRNSVADRLHDLDRAAKHQSETPTAMGIMSAFIDAVRDELSLLPNDIPLDGIIAKASSVSVGDKKPEWVTVELTSVRQSFRPGESHWGLNVHFVGNRNPVLSFGAGQAVADSLLDFSAPNADVPASQAPALVHFYELKRTEHVSELSLSSAQELAKAVVQFVISFASAHPEFCLGVGGEIQEVSVTQKETNWIASLDRSKIPLPTPSWHARVIDSPMGGKLDGFQYLRGTVRPGGTLIFYGEEDARVVDPHFTGGCTFILADGAEARMPETAERLQSAFAQHCDVYRTHGSRRELLSRGSFVQSGQTQNFYADLSNCDLKANAEALAIDLTIFVNDARSAEKALDDELMSARRLSAQKREIDALTSKYIILSEDRSIQLMSDYQSRFARDAIEVVQQLDQRLGLPPNRWGNAGQRGFTLQGIEEVATELFSLAKALPTDPSPAQKKKKTVHSR